MKTTHIFLSILILISIPAFGAETGSMVSPEYRPGDFAVVRNGRAADIYVDPKDHKVVIIAVEDFSEDVEKVTGVKPRVIKTRGQIGGEAIIAGSLDKSSLIKRLVEAGGVDVSSIRAQWESYAIMTVKDPLPGVSKALVIVGSDRRGTAYGLYELSREVGVSPWVWWADSVPDRKDEIIIRRGIYKYGPPSVKYRGIFINDEDFGMQPWAARTYEPETGDIGPGTYARVFELLLRLKANHIWPAMHKCTRAFNHYPANKVVADNYAIVMGSSHCEQMLRNNVDEWKRDGKGCWWYQFNRKNILSYWEKRVEENGKYENIYTLGMRALHDSPIHAVGGERTKLKLLRKIIKKQRGLLKKWVSPDVTEVPQVFCTYNEVLHYLERGLELPDDVTMLWVDDNHGYIRRLSTPAERKRSGGSGVYHHVSYWGPPHDYLWLCSTPPALIWEEMRKAYAHGADRIWILNVGDIKPAEIDMEFFLQMAWDIDRHGPDCQKKFLADFAHREFGEKHSTEIADIMNEYYLLNNRRKPEHMGFNMLGEKFVPTNDPRFSLVNYGNESRKRIDAYLNIERRANDVYESLPKVKRDAFYQLVLYPVLCSCRQNLKILYAHMSRVYARQARASANRYAALALEAFEKIKSATRHYNETMAGGKWRGMMSDHPKDLKVFQMPKTGNTRIKSAAIMGVSVEGAEKPIASEGRLPQFNRYTKRKYFIEIFNKGSEPFEWEAKTEEWITLSAPRGTVSLSERIWVGVDYEKAPAGDNLSGKITISGAGKNYEINITASNPLEPEIQPETFVRDNGVVAFNAENFSKNIRGKNGTRWTEIRGMGRTGAAMAITPFDSNPAAASDAPLMEYETYTDQPGNATVIVEAVPTYPINENYRSVVAFSIDDGAPVTIELERGGIEFMGFHWSEAVLASVMRGTASMDIREGFHTFKLMGIDPSVVIDRVVIDFGGLADSYLGPPETVVVK